jgi:hypothetical protein
MVASNPIIQCAINVLTNAKQASSGKCQDYYAQKYLLTVL